MKTAIQELIEWLNDYPTNVPTIHKSAVISKAESMLEKEKEQMVDWYATGQADTVNMYEQHLNKTFNPNEK
jgi:hypothetical protein